MCWPTVTSGLSLPLMVHSYHLCTSLLDSECCLHTRLTLCNGLLVIAELNLVRGIAEFTQSEVESHDP